jgi:DNA polymerase-3 subunit gamma/tau
MEIDQSASGSLHLALARKYRPRHFNQVLGQSVAVKALTNALNTQRFHHAYLLTGARGVGKTSLARIWARCLSCMKGISADPCGVCNHCISIEKGNFLDLIEIDAASKTKVEETRELLESVQYLPVLGPFKIFLIDEVHMLSNHSFNALLKTLEEPPSHVMFILATTDPQKLPITIISRCLHFSLRLLDQDELSKHLANILTQENIKYENQAIMQLGKAALGSVRDALSLTDQAIALGQGQVETEAVQQMLSTVDANHLLELLDILLVDDFELFLVKLREILAGGIEAQSLLTDLTEAFHKIALFQAIGSENKNSSTDGELLDKSWIKLARGFTPEQIQVFYQVALFGHKEMSLAPSPRIALEMIALRLFFFAQNLATNSSKQVIEKPQEIVAVKAASIIDTIQTAEINEITDKSETVPLLKTEIPFDAFEFWKDVCEKLQAQKKWTPNLWNLVQNTTLESISDIELRLHLATTHQFLLTEQISQKLKDILLEELAPIASIVIHFSQEHSHLKLSDWYKQQANLQLEQLDQMVEQDLIIQQVTQHFGAKILQKITRSIDQ